MPASPIALRHHIIKKSLPYCLLPAAMMLGGAFHLWLAPRTAATCYVMCLTTILLSNTQGLPSPLQHGFTLCYTGLQSIFKEIDEATLAKSNDILQRTDTHWLQSAVFILLYGFLQPINYVAIETLRFFYRNMEILYISIIGVFCHFGLMHLVMDGLDFSSYTNLYQRIKASLPENSIQLLLEGLPAHKILHSEETPKAAPTPVKA